MSHYGPLLSCTQGMTDFVYFYENELPK